MKIIAVGSTGDPDQYIGFGFIPQLVAQNATYSNTTSGPTSCIDVSMPPAGDYFYVLLAYTGPFNYQTQVLFNVAGVGCEIRNAPATQFARVKPVDGAKKHRFA
jgi:hypothetical protein